MINKIKFPDFTINLIIALAVISGLLQLGFLLSYIPPFSEFIANFETILREFGSFFQILFSPDFLLELVKIPLIVALILIYTLFPVFFVYPAFLGFVLDLKVDKQMVLWITFIYAGIFWSASFLLPENPGLFIIFPLFPMNFFIFFIIGLELRINGLTISTSYSINKILTFKDDGKFGGLVSLLMILLSMIGGLISFDLFNFDLFSLDLNFLNIPLNISFNILYVKRIVELVPILMLIYFGIKNHPKITKWYDWYLIFYLVSSIFLVLIMLFTIGGFFSKNISPGVLYFINGFSLISLVIGYLFGYDKEIYDELVNN